MSEKVIINRIKIKRQGERKHFQIKLPNDTTFIIGIEYGGRFMNEFRNLNFLAKTQEETKVQLPPTDTNNEVTNTETIKERTEMLFKCNVLIGELKLQSSEVSNWFYATDLYWSDVNLKYRDFSNAGFNVNDFTHGSKKTEDVVEVDAESTFIQGWYLDAIGKSQKLDIDYEVIVYVWINVKE